MTEFIVDVSEWVIDANGNPPFGKGGEIVRCGDCKHYRFKDRHEIFHDDRHNDSFCVRFIDGKRMEVEPDGFCAWGERREQ